MKKNLLTLAVAAAVAAPALASAEAIMYGKLNMSVDYQDIDTVVAPWYNGSARSEIPYTVVVGNTAVNGTIPAYPGDIIFVAPDGARSTIVQSWNATTNQYNPLTDAEQAALRGYAAVMPGGMSGSLGFKGWSLNRGPNMNGSSRANRLGVKGSEDLGNGLKAIYQIELGINMANQNENLVDNNDGITYRNTFVGLAGDWGTALIGRHDTPLKISTSKLDLFSDTMADYNGTIGFQDLRADNAIAYVSPSWSGFQLAAAIIPAGGATGFGQYNINSDSIGEGYSLAAIYSNGPFYASAAYEVLGEELLMNSSTSLNGCYTNDVFAGGVNVGKTYSCGKVNDDNTKYRFGLGLLDWNGFTLTGIYEHQDFATSDNWGTYTGIGYPALIGGYSPDFNYNLPSGPDSVDRWQIQAGYSFGNFMIKGMYGQASLDGSYTLPNFGQIGLGSQAGLLNEIADNYYKGSLESWAIGADYNFSKRTKAYVLYTETTNDQSGTPALYGLPGGVQIATGSNQSDWSGFSLGLVHSF